ncbi:MAG: MarR family winged helix-turn-helix transcriptional regulator [Paracoccaceae bacterium]
MHEVKRIQEQLGSHAQRAIAGGCACFIARKHARLLTRLYDSALAPHGLTSGQFSMIAAVAAAGVMTIQTLADAMGMDHSTTSRGVSPLIDGGLLAVGKDTSDGRKRNLCLTQRGIDKLNAASTSWAEAQIKAGVS